MLNTQLTWFGKNVNSRYERREKITSRTNSFHSLASPLGEMFSKWKITGWGGQTELRDNFHVIVHSCIVKI